MILPILKEVQQIVENNDIRGPGYWLDVATKLTVLSQNLDDDVTAAEMAYKAKIAELIEKGDKITQAKLKVESVSEEYKRFKFLESRQKIVRELVLISKKRATINLESER